MLRVGGRFSSSKNPFQALRKTSSSGLPFYGLKDFKDPAVVARMPFSIRILLENAIRNCDNFEVKEEDVDTIFKWEKLAKESKEIPFKPGRVILQDFTGVPAVVDLAAMRDAMVRLGGNPNKINPLCPVDLVIDHSVQVDVARSKDAAQKNEEIEFHRNRERFQFLKWGSTAFDNFKIVPPGSGIVHQVNLQYLAKVALTAKDGVVFPDSVVGTDSHTTMINGLGVMGWGVGGIEAEAVMLGQPISMVLPEVVGFKLTGKLSDHVTSTDLVLTIVEMLRKKKVVGKFVEFWGEGCDSLTLADRATIANMAPEYGATMGFFPLDEVAVKYLEETKRPADTIKRVRVLEEQGLFRKGKEEIVFTDTLELNLNQVEPSLSGPKRPHDRVPLTKMKTDFTSCLTNKLGFKGFGLSQSNAKGEVNFKYQGKDYKLKNGMVAIAAITSCTNTSNPDVMLAAGLLAKKAVEKGLNVAPYIKTSLSPGSGVVTKYLQSAGLSKYLNEIGFTTAGYGCMTCIGNSGDLDESLANALKSSELVGAAVLSGNRNFQARIHPNIKANYLASPPLVVAYALAGRVDIDFEKEPIGKDKAGKDVFLKDIWPSRPEVRTELSKALKPEMFSEFYSNVTEGSKLWQSLATAKSVQYSWNDKSTYIHNPPFFKHTELSPKAINKIEKARCLAVFGDSITTDHISPAGNIAKGSPAAQYLESKGVQKADYNTYGARRGNDEVMARGTFANTRIINRLVSEVGPHTMHWPSKKSMYIPDAAFKYMEQKIPVIILAGQEYGSGSSRDWAAKGPLLLGVRAVIAQSFERIHRSNLAGMGILPLEFLPGSNAESLKLTGEEEFTIDLEKLSVRGTVEVTTNKGVNFNTKCRLDTEPQIQYFKHGGILQYVLRKLIAQK